MNRIILLDKLDAGILQVSVKLVDPGIISVDAKVKMHLDVRNNAGLQLDPQLKYNSPVLCPANGSIEIQVNIRSIAMKRVIFSIGSIFGVMAVLAILTLYGAVANTSTDNELEEIYPIVKNDKWGYIDKTGKVIIEPQFDWAGPSTEGVAWAGSGEDMWDASDFTIVKAESIIPLDYEITEVWAFYEGLASVKVKTGDDEKWGFIDPDGKMIIQPTISYTHRFSEGLAWISEDKKRGFIDKTGKIVIEPQYDNAWDFSEGLAPVNIGGGVAGGGYYEGGEWFYINKDGEKVLGPFDYTHVSSFHDGLAEVKVGNYPDHKRGYIDKTGKLVIEAKYYYTKDFSNEYAMVQAGREELRECFFIDKTGNRAFDIKYRMWDSFSEGLAAVRDPETGKCGYIDTTGKLVIDAKYDVAWEFRGGVAGIRMGLYEIGWIDTTGEYIWEPTR